MLQITNVSPYTNLVGARGEHKKNAPVKIVFIEGRTIYPVFFEIDFSKETDKSRDHEDDHWEPPTSWRSLSDD